MRPFRTSVFCHCFGVYTGGSCLRTRENYFKLAEFQIKQAGQHYGEKRWGSKGLWIQHEFGLYIHIRTKRDAHVWYVWWFSVQSCWDLLESELRIFGGKASYVRYISDNGPGLIQTHPVNLQQRELAEVQLPSCNRTVGFWYTWHHLAKDTVVSTRNRLKCATKVTDCVVVPEPPNLLLHAWFKHVLFSQVFPSNFVGTFFFSVIFELQRWKKSCASLFLCQFRTKRFRNRWVWLYQR